MSTVSRADLYVIRESFGRVVYSHKTHEKAREIESSRAAKVKYANVFLTAMTGGSLVTTLVTDRRIALYVGSVLGAITLGFLIYQLRINPEREAERHRAAAKELWSIRERYLNLIADATVDPENADVKARRDSLVQELGLVYKFAPDTSSKAYMAAQKALKVDEEMTFSDHEIDAFLPKPLRVTKPLAAQKNPQAGP